MTDGEASMHLLVGWNELNLGQDATNTALLSSDAALASMQYDVGRCLAKNAMAHAMQAMRHFQKESRCRGEALAIVRRARVFLSLTGTN